jgi:DNA invertase Pin-like site-specific DNA recombinase
MKTKSAAAAVAPRFVSYCRVSTDEQGRSGLGLDAQGDAIAAFVKAEGGVILSRFVEVESGANDDRPKLAAALAMARRARATLVVARLDRLSRNEVKALSLTQQYDIRFADVDTKDPLTVGVLALLAAKERRDIAARTKAALRVLLARGVKLGSARAGHWDGREERRLAGARIGNRAAAEKARALSADLYSEARQVADDVRRREPEASLRRIAAAIEQAGLLTARGSTTWTPVAVRRMLDATEPVVIASTTTTVA